MLKKPEILMTPGPTPVPPEVLLAQGSPIVYHRGPGFGEVLRHVTEGLQWVFETKNDIVTFTSSGSGGMEAAVVNLFSPGDKVLVVSVGNFGNRFKKICDVYGLEVDFLEYEWGKTAKAADVQKALKPDHRGVLIQHSETSTGVVNDIESVAKVVRDHPALFVVDSISGVGGAPIKVDAWGIDCAIGGSQKALMGSPGISFMTISPKAWEANKVAKCPRFYWDWAPVKKSYERPDPETPYTPAVHLYMGLAEAIRLLRDEGLANAFARHAILSRAVKAGVKALGLDLFGEDPERAVCVTAVKCPEGIDGDKLTALIRAKYGIIFAPGQDALKGKIFRIGHIGYLERSEILQALAVLELALDELGYPVKRGDAVAAAEEVFAQA
ncbi:MAG: alanine--glyoxylate aminotransferase family protein [Actinomycetota bacterium]|nr:alanine--glyoxylate aminotransferase family protein [Actinomycetota bacterium]